MIKHYFKIAVRNLVKQKGLALINVFGLSVGLSCFILFLLFAVNEFSFDRFHKNKENIYRTYLHMNAMNGMEEHESCYLPIPLGPAMKQDFPEVENYVRFKDSWDESFVKADNKVARIKVSFADPQFLSVFSFRTIYGDAKTALKNPNNIVITKNKALQLFGEPNVVGKTIEIKVEDNFDPFTITAVSENIPANSTIIFDILGSFDYYMSTPGGKRGVDNWFRSGYQTYIQLRPGSKLVNGSEQFKKFRKKYYPDEEAELKKDKLWTAKGSPATYGLEALRDMHTNVKIGGGGIDSVNPKNIWILLAIAFGVLLIACINFTTLAIGRSAGRAKEIGVRKVIGGEKKQLVLQFLTEAILLSILSAALGLLLGKLLLPYFNQLSGRELSFSFSQYPEMAWMLVGLVLLVGLLAGSYPALILSGFKPIEVLKSKIRVGGSNIFTKSLVTVQFILSIGLIISTVIILQQLKYMQNKNPGFNKENIVMVDAEGTETKKIYPLFKQALAVQPSIMGLTASELGLGEGTGWSRSGFEYNGKHKEVYEYFVDANYIKLMGMKLIAGRDFDPKIASDTIISVIINEAMLNDFGWTINNAVGQPLKGYSENLTPVVIGVVKNFNFRPFSEKIEPQMFHQFHDYAPYKYFVKIKAGDPSVALNTIQKAWTSVVPDLPLKYDFLDESLNRFYKSESRWSNIVGWAGGISIFLAGLGLFGLAALAAVNRTKEIGIRKIRINISWIVFAAAAIFGLAIALFTVGLQAIRVGLRNPVKSLRTE